MFCILTIKHIHCSIVHSHSNSGKLTRSTIPRENSIFATMRGKNKWMNMLFSELLWRECATPTVDTFGYFYFVSFEVTLLLLIVCCVHKCLLLTLWLIAIFFFLLFSFIAFHWNRSMWHIGRGGCEILMRNSEQPSHMNRTSVNQHFPENIWRQQLLHSLTYRRYPSVSE